MDALYARFPFLEAARAAVDSADVDLASVATDPDGPVVTRAMDRIESAIDEATVGEQHRSTRVELLSYPVARVLVSLVDDPGLTRRYARAEAATAMARFAADREMPDYQSVRPERLDLDALLAEFDLAGTVEETPAGFRVAVGTYLGLAAGLDEDRWRLVNRPVAGGRVPVDRDEVDSLLREAIRGRVERELPLSVPDPIAEALLDRVEEVRSWLAEYELTRDFEAVEPALFPPCMRALLDRAASEAPLAAHSRFNLASFLACVGMDPESIAERLGEAGTTTGGLPYGIDRLHDGSGGVYPPPSCATMDAYGDCVNKDALCERIPNPLEYYDRRLDRPDAAPEAVADPYSLPESQ